MLDFENVDNTQFNELKQTIQKSVEKSDLDRYYLFSTDKFIKAKLFILCYRFLLNAWNLTGAGGLKDELKSEIDLLEPTYERISYLLNFIDSGRKYGKHLVTEQLFYEVNKQEVSNLIDIFAILTERVNIISIDRFKGVIMEGKSGDEFNRIMKGDMKKRYSDEDTELEEETLAPVKDFVPEKEEQEETEVEAEEDLDGEDFNELVEEAWKSPKDDSQEPYLPEEEIELEPEEEFGLDEEE